MRIHSFKKFTSLSWWFVSLWFSSFSLTQVAAVINSEILQEGKYIADPGQKDLPLFLEIKNYPACWQSRRKEGCEK